MRNLSNPFAGSAPRFFDFLRHGRGLREATVVQYRHHLHRLEDYLRRTGIPSLAKLSPAVVTAFISETGKSLDKRSVQSLCSIVKTFLRYLHQTRTLTRDLSRQVESPRRYRLADLPRPISLEEVQRLFKAVDRRSSVGKRDYAILLLLVTYGLRAREVAALKLEDIDWKCDPLHVRGRKAGHFDVYPLVPMVGEALLDYSQQNRPKAAARALFFRALAPHTPLSWHAVSLRTKHYIRKAGIKVPRPGSHTLHHTCVQRLVEAHLPLKTVGDFVGHRTPDATAVYVADDTLDDLQSLRDKKHAPIRGKGRRFWRQELCACTDIGFKKYTPDISTYCPWQASKSAWIFSKGTEGTIRFALEMMYPFPKGRPNTPIARWTISLSSWGLSASRD